MQGTGVVVLSKDSNPSTSHYSTIVRPSSLNYKIRLMEAA